MRGRVGAVLMAVGIATPAAAQIQQPSSTLPSHVIVDSCSGCGGAGSGVTDADDASIAAGQTGVSLSLGLMQVYNGSVWRRLTFGQAAMASSLPVVLASDQPAIPVSAASLPLPSNAASETGGNLATVKTNTDKLDIALSALRDALRGASSKTLTDVVTALTGLSVSISGTVTVTGGLTDTQLRATPVPVSGTVAATESGTWTVQPGNTANTTAWKVDGSAVTQPVSGTFWQVTQPVSIASMPSTPVTGTFWQSTQPISAAALPLPTLAATSTKQSDGSQKTQIVDGAGNVIGATSNALDINIKSGNPTTLIGDAGDRQQPARGRGYGAVDGDDRRQRCHCRRTRRRRPAATSRRSPAKTSRPAPSRTPRTPRWRRSPRRDDGRRRRLDGRHARSTASIR
jgi:hypothetical protein